MNVEKIDNIQTVRNHKMHSHAFHKLLRIDLDILEDTCIMFSPKRIRKALSIQKNVRKYSEACEAYQTTGWSRKLERMESMRLILDFNDVKLDLNHCNRVCFHTYL